MEKNGKTFIKGLVIGATMTVPGVSGGSMAMVLGIYDRLLKHVSEIEYSPDIKNEKVIDKNRFLLRMNDGNYVYINLANMDNLNKYEEIYTTLDENKKGILNLDSTSKGVVFQPFDLIKEKEETKDELSE